MFIWHLIWCIITVFVISEARVYCQDNNAAPWIPFGASCPVVCENIVSAIERLKDIDMKHLLHHQLKIQRDNMKRYKEIQQNLIFDENPTRSRLYKEPIKNISDTTDYIKLLRQKMAGNDTNKVFKMADFNGCFKSNFIAKLTPVNETCARKSYFDNKFVSIMTNILNKHIKSPMKFTAEMTEILLEKIYGKNTDLRNSIFDVNKLLLYLRDSVRIHKEHSDDSIIDLKPQKCLTISFPGCYCRTGYVENSGQCVKPIDCVKKTVHRKYLSRIIVH